MSYTFTNLSESMMENIKSLGQKMTELEKAVREDLGIKDCCKVSITKCWDESIKVFSDGVCLGDYRLRGGKYVRTTL